MRDKIKHVTIIFSVSVLMFLVYYFWKGIVIFAAITSFSFVVLLFVYSSEFLSLIEYNRDKNKFYMNFKISLAESNSYQEFYQTFYLGWVDKTYNFKKYGIKNPYSNN